LTKLLQNRDKRCRKLASRSQRRESLLLTELKARTPTKDINKTTNALD